MRIDNTSLILDFIIPRKYRSNLLSVLLLLAFVVYAPIVYAAEDYKLSDTLVLDGDVISYQISPDGNWVVYLASQDDVFVNELYRVPMAGGASLKLNGSLVVDGDVTSFAISPDSSRVVYRADQDTNFVTELYSVPMAGGAPVKLNKDTIAAVDGDVHSFTISPDSSRVVYFADQEIDGVDELFSAPLDGGTSAIKLSYSLPVNGGVFAKYVISPDSSWVVYRADQEANFRDEIYSVPLTGGTSIKLNGSLVLGGDVYPSFDISPDSSRVVYRADQDTNDVFELYSAPISGGGSIKLNGSLVAGGNVRHGFDISPDNSRVLYHADQDKDGVTELYSVPLTGGASIKLNGSLVVGGEVQINFVISPDSNQVVYRADQDTDGVNELYSVPLAGGTSVKLNGPLTAGGNVSSYHATISPDSSRVLYLGDQDTDGVTELYSVPITGGGVVKLNGPLLNGSVSSQFSITSDSSRVVYKAIQDSLAISELYFVPIVGGMSFKLNGALTFASSVYSDSSITPDNSRVVYRAIQDTVDTIELYAAFLPINTFPYSEDFESGSARWIPDGTLWELGKPNNTVIMDASSGLNAWITDIDANYPNNVFEAVVSPVFDFSDFIQDPIIEMDVWWQSEVSSDGVVLQSSIDGGTTWLDVGVKGDPVKWFNNDIINGLSGNGQTGHGWSGAGVNGSGGYIRASHALTGLAGQTAVQLRVLFGSDGSGIDNGFAFDNIFIGGDFDGDGDPDVTDPDDDNDGLTDPYENANGLNPFDASDAGLDPDMDGLTTLDEFTLNTNLNPNDPDTDGDGIDDGLDTEPLMTNNDCTGGTMSGALFVDATFLETVSTEMTCGATNSILVNPTTIQSPGGNLLLIAPTVIFEPGFNASGELRVNTANSCVSCGP